MQVSQINLPSMNTAARYNVTGGSANDTRAFWFNQPSGFYWFNQSGMLNGQPNQYGYLLNLHLTGSNEIQQLFWVAPNGAHYKRGVNGAATAMPGWRKYAEGMTFGNYEVIKWKQNSTDEYGEGIVIGGGGATIIGGGESATTMAGSFSNGGDEKMYICNDNAIDFYTNCNNGAPSYPQFSMRTDGDFQIRYGTATSIGSGSVGAKITFFNQDASQWGRFIYTDIDAVEVGASITWITNQSQSWFRVQNLRAYGQGYSPKWNTTSDKRLKDHIAYLGKEAVKFIKSLLPAKFKMNDETKLGFYAQDIEGDEIYGTDMVSTTGKDEIRSLDYNQLIAPLVAAVQDLTKRVEDLEKKLGE